MCVLNSCIEETKKSVLIANRKARFFIPAGLETKLYPLK
jgi:hypothetical protein